MFWEAGTFGLTSLKLFVGVTVLGLAAVVYLLWRLQKRTERPTILTRFCRRRPVYGGRRLAGRSRASPLQSRRFLRLFSWSSRSLRCPSTCGLLRLALMTPRGQNHVSSAGVQ